MNKLSRSLPMKVLLAWFAGSAISVLAACPDTDSDALAWLDRMSHSLRQVSYEGVVTFSRGEDLQVMQVSHDVNAGLESEYLTQLTGQGARITRADHPLDCVHPGHRMLRMGEEMSRGNCGIAANYRLAVAAGERVAGRATVNIRVKPRDMYRYGYLMALDKETGLLLKTRTLARGGVTLEHFQFANLRIGKPSSVDEQQNLAYRAPHFAPQVTGHTLGQQWRVRWLPAGFARTDDATQDAGRRTFTDGLAVFSVFVESLARPVKPGEGVVRKGSTTSYTRGVRVGGQSALVTVVGEVPLNTARMVADSVAWSS